MRASSATGASRLVKLVDVEVLRLLVGVDVAVEAVPLVRELLHQVVVVVAHPVADGDEVDALAPGLRDAGGDALGAGHADVGHAVGAEHHDVDAAGTVRRPGLLVAQRQTVGQVGAAARVEVVDRGQHALVLGDRGRREEQLDLVVEADHRDGVVGAQRPGQQRQGVLHQADAVALAHAARAVHDQGQVDRRPLRGGDLARGDGHPDRLRAVGVGPDARLGADGEVGLGRRRVAVREGVDPLLRAHRLRRRAGALGDVRLRDPVGAVVDVEGERRQRVARGVDVAADPLVLERVARARSAGRAGRAGRRCPARRWRPDHRCRPHPRTRSGRAHSPSRSGSRRTAVVSSCRLRRGFADGRSAILASRPDRDLTVIPT